MTASNVPAFPPVPAAESGGSRPAGLAFAAANPSPLAPSLREQIAFDFNEVRLRPASTTPEAEATPEATLLPLIASPDERLGQALQEIRQSVAAELSDALSRVSPGFFETIVLDLLHKLGYGTSRADLQRVGGVGDGGIDGIISLDRLGLEKVYVQAKRWQNPVGRPEVQGFYGALAAHRANKGVLITTSSFTPHALDFARSVAIVLVDGRRLAELMIDFEIGITSRTIRIPKLDGDYFDEESA